MTTIEIDAKLEFGFELTKEERTLAQVMMYSYLENVNTVIKQLREVRTLKITEHVEDE